MRVGNPKSRNDDHPLDDAGPTDLPPAEWTKAKDYSIGDRLQKAWI